MKYIDRYWVLLILFVLFLYLSLYLVHTWEAK